MLDDFFIQYPVFHYDELLVYLRQEKTYKETTLKALLRYHVQKKHITRIRRGYYAVISNTKEHTIVDPLLIGGRATPQSIIAYHSALVFHGIAYSTSNTIFFISEPFSQDFEFDQIKYHSILPVSVLTQENLFTETKTHDRLGLTIRVTTIERTLVDCLDKVNYSGGFEEIWQAAHMIDFIDIERMVDYVIRLNNATTIAKVGFFLEQHRDHFDVNENDLNRLESRKPKGVHYLSKAYQDNVYMRRWHLMVPEMIKNKTWEE